MSCKVDSKKLSLYLDARYEAAESRELKAHIEGCPVCKERLEQLRLMKGSLSSLAPIKESEGFDLEFNRLLDERLSGKVPLLKSLLDKIREILLRGRDTFIYPVPVAVRVAASFVLITTVLFGARIHMGYKTPFIRFAAGDVKVYQPAKKTWIPLEAGMKLKAGDKIHSKKGAIYDIGSQGRYMARVKDNSAITVAGIRNGWRNIDTDFEVSYGNLMVNTTDRFKGSKMRIFTPSCDAEIVGTAFMVKVLGRETWLGVLEGTVRVISKVHPLKAESAKMKSVNVSSGQKVSVKPYLYPTTPELFSEKEWRMMQELYQLTEKPKIILLIGTGSDRIEELLGPRPVYISGVENLSSLKEVSEKISVMSEALKNRNNRLLTETAKALEAIIKKQPYSEYNIQILMFIASYYHQIRDYDNAIRIFSSIMQSYPDSSLASLAQCAVATIYLKDLREIDKARQTYMQLIEAYPDSVDAIKAKEALSAIK